MDAQIWYCSVKLCISSVVRKKIKFQNTEWCLSNSCHGNSGVSIPLCGFMETLQVTTNYKARYKQEGEGLYAIFEHCLIVTTEKWTTAFPYLEVCPKGVNEVNDNIKRVNENTKELMKYMTISKGLMKQYIGTPVWLTNGAVVGR